MKQKIIINCPACDRHIEIIYMTGINFPQTENRELWGCDDSIECPKCKKVIIVYGAVTVFDASLTGTKVST